MKQPHVPAFDCPKTNRQIVLTRRPAAHPTKEDLTIRETIRPEIGHDQLLVRNIYLSADPVQRGWAVALPLDSVMRSLAVGIVVESKRAGFAEGDLLFGIFGWQDYAMPTPEEILSHIPAPRAPASAYAGVLGMPGATALLALETLAPVQEGQTVFVSTAAGAVGSVVGQLVNRAGASAIGLTGSDAKVEKCLSRFGYSACANYKTADVPPYMADNMGDGFDSYFDNTGGWILDNAIRHMGKYGRIIQCGTAATPSWNPPPTGWRNERDILTRVLTWSGFYIFDHQPVFTAAVERLSDIMNDTGLEYDEDIETGFDKTPGALDSLFAGTNVGKKLVFIGGD